MTAHIDKLKTILKFVQNKSVYYYLVYKIHKKILLCPFCVLSGLKNIFKQINLVIMHVIVNISVHKVSFSTQMLNIVNL